MSAQPSAQGGDVDATGDLVDELRRSVWLVSDPRAARLRSAIDTDPSTTDPAEHLRLVARALANVDGRPYE